MNQSLHFAHKDLRKYRPLVALALACLVGAPFATYYGLAIGKLGPVPASFLVEIVKWPLVVLLALAIIQDDSPLGIRSFWLTRPIRPLALLGGKLLLLTASITLPGAIAAATLALAVDADAVTALAVGTQVAITMEVALVAAALLGALSRDVVHTGRNMFVLLIGWWLFGMTVSFISPQTNLLPDPRPGITLGSQVLFGMSVFLAFGVAILGWFYRRRRVVPATVAAVAALFGALYAGRLCPFPIVPEPMTPTAEVAQARPELPALQIDAENQARLFGHRWVAVPGRGRQAHRIASVNARAVNVPDSWLVEIRGVDTELTLADGSVRQMPGVVPSHNWTGSHLTDDPIRRFLGLPPRAEGKDDVPLQLFSLGADEEPAPAGMPATAKARVRLRHSAFREVGRAPLRAGATIPLGGELLRIDDVAVADTGRLNMQTRHIRATIMLHPVVRARPDQADTRPAQNFGYILHHPGRQEFTYSFYDPRRRVDFGVIVLQTLVTHQYPVGFGPGGAFSKFDASWLEEAELILVQVHPMGENEQTLTIEGFTLVR